MKKREIIKKTLLFAAAAALLVAGCKTDTTASRKDFPISVKDDAGRQVKIGAAPKRIVSLTPANTEILFALGLGDRVVGVTTFCDYPPEASKKRKIGDFMNPNIELILASKPDLVLGTIGVQKALIDGLDKVGAVVYVSDPKDIKGVIDNIIEIGKITGREAAANTIAASMRADIREVEAAAGKDKPTVFYEVASDPLYTGAKGTFVDDAIRLAGGTNIAATAGSGYIMFNVEDLVKQDPDIYLVVSGSMNDPKQLETRPGYSALTAVKEGRVYTMDDNLVSRPGPRITKGLNEIAKIIQSGASD